jgi:PAT family beta-lactamase induction signal transducer AmpG
MGPFVDAFSSDRFGRAALWILGMQVGMMATLVVRDADRLRRADRALHRVIFLHNAFGATQDVAIDALAVNVLPEHERGVANGFMFAGASIGQTIGGSGVLFLTAVMPFASTYIFVAARSCSSRCSSCCRCRSRRGRRAPHGKGRSPRSARTSRASCARRGGVHGIAPGARRRRRVAAAVRRLRAVARAAIEPRGRARPRRQRVAQLNLASTVVFALACVAGGWVSDRFGRRSIARAVRVPDRRPDAVARVRDAAGRMDHADRRHGGEPSCADAALVHVLGRR